LKEKTPIDSFVKENYNEPSPIEYSYEKIGGNKFRVIDFLQNKITLNSFKSVKAYLEDHRKMARKEHRRLIVTDVNQKIRATTLIEINNLIENSHDSIKVNSEVNRWRRLVTSPHLRKKRDKKPIDTRIYERNF
jgi:hypothetical protein